MKLGIDFSELHIHHHIHESGPGPSGTARILAALETLSQQQEDMNEALQTALSNLTASTEATVGKLNSIETYVKGIPDVVAGAVKAALDAANVEEAAAATIVADAQAKTEKEVGDVLAAIDANNPPPAPEPVVITINTTLPNATAGADYSASLSASGGTEPYTWAGALSGGLSLSSDGVVSGNVADAGTQSFDVTATDANGVSGTATVTLTIDPAV